MIYAQVQVLIPNLIGADDIMLGEPTTTSHGNEIQNETSVSIHLESYYRFILKTSVPMNPWVLFEYF